MADTQLIRCPSCNATNRVQQQAWLEQQKMEWLAKRQAEWEAAGKPTPWAEWIREREFAWAVTEVPNQELVWRTCIAKKNNLTYSKLQMNAS